MVSVLDAVKFINNLRQVGGFLRVLLFSPPNKTDLHDIAEIFLKVVISLTITFTHFYNIIKYTKSLR